MPGPRLPHHAAHHVREAITALRNVLVDLDEASHAEVANFEGIAVLQNVRERGLEPMMSNLMAALLGHYQDEDDTYYEDEEN